jgi:DNA-binding CsgD family transcriptional regulator
MPAQLWNVVAGKLRLGPREKQIVELILRHQPQKEIARLLGIETCTVQSYLRRLYNRLRVSDSPELVLRIFAESHGLNRPHQ